MNEAPRLRVRQLLKRFDASFALEIEALQVARDATLCLVGPTGAGKSTLLRILAGLEHDYRGQLEFEGQPTAAGGYSLEIMRRLTLVHQQPLLLTRNVWQNIEYGLRLRGERDRSLARHWFERLGLQSLALQSTRTLSGGQAQLVSLARALALRPEVLLLDEPTANLDPARVALVEEVLREYRAQQPCTMVWATHNLFQARRVARDIALLVGGQLVECAATEAFFEAPRDPRTAAFTQGKMIY